LSRYEPAGSVQRGEAVLVSLLTVRLLSTRDNQRTLRASWRSPRGDYFHCDWHWPAGHLQSSVLAALLETISERTNDALLGAEGVQIDLGIGGLPLADADGGQRSRVGGSSPRPDPSEPF